MMTPKKSRCSRRGFNKAYDFIRDQCDDDFEGEIHEAVKDAVLSIKDNIFFNFSCDDDDERDAFDEAFKTLVEDVLPEHLIDDLFDKHQIHEHSLIVDVKVEAYDKLNDIVSKIEEIDGVIRAEMHSDDEDCSVSCSGCQCDADADVDEDDEFDD